VVKYTEQKRSHYTIALLLPDILSSHTRSAFCALPMNGTNRGEDPSHSVSFSLNCKSGVLPNIIKPVKVGLKRQKPGLLRVLMLEDKHGSRMRYTFRTHGLAMVSDFRRL
jgi:hypothetical protein